VDALDLVEEEVHGLRLLRPRDAEALLDEEAFGDDEFLPYWAELWPAALALAGALPAVEGRRVVELGCGLALPSLVAASRGADALATDWARDALDLVEANAERNGLHVETLLCSWFEPEPLLERAPFDLVLASDVLYERRNLDPLLELLPLLAGDVLMADPSRPYATAFLERAAEEWEVEIRADATTPRMRLHRLRRA
jgi:predicted nicotinamide N-methyase